MNGWDRYSFAKRVVAEMQHRQPTTTWKEVGLRKIEVSIGRVILTLTISDTGLDAEYRLHNVDEEFANIVIGDARSSFKSAFAVVAEELLGLTERTPSQV